MALATIASIAAITAAAASVGSLAYNAAQGTPSVPNAASSSRQVAQAQAEALPIQRALAAAEAQGGTALTPGYTSSTYSAQQAQHAISQIQHQIQQIKGGTDKSGNPLPLSGDQQTKLLTLQNQLKGIPAQGGTVYLDSQGKIADASNALLDFKGYGTADIEGKLAGQYADIQQNLGEKYGTQFAEEAAKEAALADPQGTAARKAEYDLIQKGINNPPPINPLSTSLESGIDSQLKAGRGLDPMSQQLLDASVAKANAARGGGASASDIEQSMSTGAAGQARLEAALAKSQGFLNSGATPEDIAYRREQQNLSNLGSFVGGTTPEAQFRNLSSAGQGAAPFQPGQPAPQLPANAGSGGDAYSISAYNANARNATQQANPWMAGLSSLLSGIGAATKVAG